jgi:hypothetical protein
MAKSVKKVDPKMVAKLEVMSIVTKALQDAGLSVADGEQFGMTKGTIVVSHAVSDIQIKPVAPKTGVDRYEVAEAE